MQAPHPRRPSPISILLSPRKPNPSPKASPSPQASPLGSPQESLFAVSYDEASDKFKRILKDVFDEKSILNEDREYLEKDLKELAKNLTGILSDESNWTLLHSLAKYPLEFVKLVIQHIEANEIANMSQKKAHLNLLVDTKPAGIAKMHSKLTNGISFKKEFLQLLAKYADFSLVDAYFIRKFNKEKMKGVWQKKFGEFLSYLLTALKTPAEIKKFELERWFGVSEFLSLPFKEKEYQSLIEALHSYLKTLPEEKIQKKAKRFLKRVGVNNYDEYLVLRNEKNEKN